MTVSPAVLHTNERNTEIRCKEGARFSSPSALLPGGTTASQGVERAPGHSSAQCSYLSVPFDKLTARKGHTAAKGGMARTGASGEGESAAGAGGKTPSYRYWVAKPGDGAEAPAPPAAPKRLTPEEAAQLARTSSAGSLWNQAGTWEEKNLVDWAKQRLTCLVRCTHTVEFEGRKHEVAVEMQSCHGDATIVIVRNKKRHGYSFAITLKFTGPTSDPGGDAVKVAGTAHVPEASYGELDDIELLVTLRTEAAVPTGARGAELARRVRDALLPALREQLRAFKAELLQR